MSACSAGPATQAPTSGGYPLSIDNCGNRIVIAEPPQRVVTIKSTATEMLLALGLGDRIVASAFQDGPVPEKWKQQIPVISKSLPAQEPVLAYSPDFIFGGWESNFTPEGVGDRSSLAKLNISTYVAPAACLKPGYKPDPLTFDKVFAGISEIGQIFDAEAAAEQFVVQERQKLAAIVPSTQEHSTLWFSSGSETPYVGAGTGAPQMLMEAAGLVNVMADVQESWASASWEVIAERNPETIVLVDSSWGSTEKKKSVLEAHPVMSQLEAVKNKRYIVVPFAASEAGVRNVDCAEFFHDWYTPENAVLTVSGRHSMDQIEQLADRYFGPVPPRATKGRARLDDAELPASRAASFHDPNVTLPGVSISYRIPGPDVEPDSYLALNALARLLSLQSGQSSALADIDAQTGYFGAFDAVTPEVFNVVLTVGNGAGCDSAVEVFDDALAAFQDPAAVDRHLKPALGTLRRHYMLTGTDLLDRCRFIGKAELLFGNPDLISSLPQRVAALTATDLARAAQSLVAKKRAVVNILPTKGTGMVTASGDLQKTLGAISIPDGRDTRAQALGWGPTRGLASYAEVREPESTGLAESLSFTTSTRGGISVALCRENRTSLVELRLRFATDGVGWEDPWGVRRIVDGIRGRMEILRPALAGSLDMDVRADGEMIEFSGRAEPAGLPGWFGAVEDCISGDWPPLPPAPQSPAQSLGMLSDVIARKLLIDAAGWTGMPSHGTTERPNRQIFTKTAATLVVIGNIDADELEESLANLGLPEDREGMDRVLALPGRPNLRQEVQVDGSTTVLSSYFLETDTAGIPEAARYITAALYGGSPLSRLHRNPLLETVIARTGGIVGRRTIAGRPVSTTRIVAGSSAFAAAAKEMKREEKSFRVYPPAKAEIAQAIKYCENELRNVSDSPQTKADYFANLMSRGIPLDRYHYIGAELREVTPELVAATFDSLFSCERITVSVGNLANLEGA
ncbi:putative F420-0 ABC transporter substrate-binding protein [Arthrobacter sp. FW305-123]|nr:putative F420-0 ABC transporter substrate-binding protein [Arthrobacter sp. FW305-123]